MYSKPLGPQGNRRYRRRIIDLASDTPINEPRESASPDCILIADGSFMQRHNRSDWDSVVYVNTSFPEAMHRGIERDAEQFGSVAAEQRSAQRYHAAARMYVREINPGLNADFVIDNDDLCHPQLHRNRRRPMSTVMPSGSGGGPWRAVGACRYSVEEQAKIPLLMAISAS
jgi:uridine kinase